MRPGHPGRPRGTNNLMYVRCFFRFTCQSFRVMTVPQSDFQKNAFDFKTFDPLKLEFSRFFQPIRGTCCPGVSYTAPDGCNTCICPASGLMSDRVSDGGGFSRFHLEDPTWLVDIEYLSYLRGMINANGDW